MTIALNMDCMEYMATLKDNAFSLAIVDPPYGISAAYNLGFDFVGIEINEQYFQDQENRFKQFISQPL